MLQSVALRIFALMLLFPKLTNEALADERLVGLRETATITVDKEGISHVRSANEHDLYFMQGWVHVRERLFHMDYNRHLASGTLTELVGTAALSSDVQLRTINLRRAAQRSYAAASPRTRAVLDGYARVVNAWAKAHSLPPKEVSPTIL